MPAVVKLKAYYTLIHSKFIYDILSWGKRYRCNIVMMRKAINRAWEVVSYENLDACRDLLNFDYFQLFCGE